MSFLIASIVKDLRRLRRDPVALAIWIGMPLFLAVMMSTLFGRGGPKPQGKLFLADEDQSFISRLAAGVFGQGELGSMIAVEKVTTAEGRTRMEKGDGAALLVIPKGFGSAFLENKPAELQLVTNPSQSIMPAMIEETVRILAEAGFYLQEAAGDQLRQMSAAPTDSSVVAMSLALNRIGKHVGSHLSPARIKLESRIVEEKKSAGGGGFGAAFVPGILFLSALFTGMGWSDDIWRERTLGTLRRLVTTPRRVELLAAGKLAVAAIVLLFVGGAGLLGAHWLLDLPSQNLPLAILWFAATGCVLFEALMLLQLFASSQRAAHLLANFAVFPLAMLGGSFFPLEMMPGWLAAVGRRTPNGWAVAQFSSILNGSLTWAGALPLLGAVILVLAGLFWLVSRRLRKGFAV